MQQTINIDRYDEIIQKLKNLTYYYENTLANNKCFLGLANGDNINIVFPKNNIPHLLGVYTDRLKVINRAKYADSSYDILKKLINSDLTYLGMRNVNPDFDIGSLFSEHIDSKLEIFVNILKLRNDDIHCIIKYCSDRSYTSTTEKENSHYFIVRKHGTKYSALGIAKNEGFNNYVPVTARLFNDEDELNDFLEKTVKNQEITYPYMFSIKNPYNDFNIDHYTDLLEKLKYGKVLQEIALKYNAIPSVINDAIANINKCLNGKQKANNTSSILTKIKEKIRSNEYIDKNEIIEMLDGGDIPEDLETLIDECNNLIFYSYNGSQADANNYFDTQNENENLKEQLIALREQVASLQAQLNETETENHSLKEENEIKNQKLKVLTDAFESIKTI